VAESVVIFKNAGYAAARAVDLTDLAEATKAAVVSQATLHVLTSRYMSGIGSAYEMVKGVKHHIIYVDDENVYAIEWGHYPGGDKSRDRVPGQFVMSNAFRQIAGL